MKKQLLLKCKKCGTKKANILYYEIILTGAFEMLVDSKGREDITLGDYNSIDDFVNNMLVQLKKKRLLGCDKCIN